MSILENFSSFLTFVLGALFIKFGAIQEPVAPFNKHPAPLDRGVSVGSKKGSRNRKKEQNSSFSSSHLYQHGSGDPRNVSLLQISRVPMRAKAIDSFEQELPAEPFKAFHKISKKQSQYVSVNPSEAEFLGDQVSEEETSNAFVDVLVKEKKNLKHTDGISALERKIQIKKPLVEAAEALQKMDIPARVDFVLAQKKIVYDFISLDEVEILEPIVIEKQEIWKKYEGWVIDVAAEKKETSEFAVEEIPSLEPEDLIKEDSYRYQILTAANNLKDGGLKALEEKLEKKFIKDFFPQTLESFERWINQRIASRKAPMLAQKSANDLEIYSLDDVINWIEQYFASRKDTPVEEAIIQKNRTYADWDFSKSPLVEAAEILEPMAESEPVTLEFQIQKLLNYLNIFEKAKEGGDEEENDQHIKSVKNLLEILEPRYDEILQEDALKDAEPIKSVEDIERKIEFLKALNEKLKKNIESKDARKINKDALDKAQTKVVRDLKIFIILNSQFNGHYVLIIRL